MSGVLAAVLAAVAAALVAGPKPNPLRSRLSGLARAGLAGSGIAGDGQRPPWASRLPVPLQMVFGSGAGAVVGGLVAPPGGAIIAAVAPPAAVLLWSRRRSRSALRRREAAVAEACLALAGELRAGLPPERCMAVVAADWPELFGPVVGRTAVGGDPASALRTVARRPGAGALGAVAAAWDVSLRTGAGLSSVLTAVTDSLRAAESIRREANSQLASVRATARLLALLPVATLLLFSTGDGRTPIEFLLTSPYGLVCLGLAVGFIAVGLAWVERTARQARSTAWEG